MIGRLLRGGFMTAIYAYLYIPIIILIVIALAGIRLIFTITEIPIMDMLWHQLAGFYHQMV